MGMTPSLRQPQGRAREKMEFTAVKKSSAGLEPVFDILHKDDNAFDLLDVDLIARVEVHEPSGQGS
jgi:hypothetical protein